MRRNLLTAAVMFIGAFSSCQKEQNKPGDAVVQALTSKHVEGAPVTIAQVSPSSGIVYSAVKITGTNFSPVATENTVKVNGVTAIINSATSTEIVATVPVSATGKITVTTGSSTATSASDFKVLRLVKEATLATPHQILGFAFDKTGNGAVYAEDGKNVYKITPDGNSAIIYTVPPGYLEPIVNDQPYYFDYSIDAITTSGNGSVYAAVRHNLFSDGDNIPHPSGGSLVKILGLHSPFLTGGNVDTISFYEISGAEIVDAANSLYLMDQNILKKVTASGIISTLYTPVNGNNGTATHLTSYNTGDVFFNDLHVIKKLDTQGNITDFAGNNDIHRVGNIDGQSSQASIFYPLSIETDGANNIFILDENQNYNGLPLIRIVNTAGYVSTYPLVQNITQIGIDKSTGKIYAADAHSVTRYSFK